MESLSETTVEITAITAFNADHLHQQLAEHRDQCNDCGACRRYCAFLQRYGTPGAIARAYPHQPAELPFQCSLCGLCNAMCPAKLDIKALFLEMRRAAVAADPGQLKRFRGLRSYESLGTSRLFSCYALPENCKSVFFPGCALPGSRPQLTWNLYRHLQQQIPQLGLVLDCCTKPSHDLGDQPRFSEKFGQLCTTLHQRGIGRVLTACPNCYQVFKMYAPHLEVLTVYEQLDQCGAPRHDRLEGRVTLHDPCVNRFEPHIHQAARSLLDSSGLHCEEMPNHGRHAFCCGEGGCVMAVAPDLANQWRQQRVRQSQQRLIATYCAGCVEFLQPMTPTVHLLDLLFDPQTTLDGKTASAGSLKRYLNRLWLKNRLKKEPNLSPTGARIHMPNATAPRRSSWPKIAAVLLIVAAIVALNTSGISANFEPQRLQQWIAGYGLWAPLVFILLYTLTPALFLPGLPLTILGGVLFGPIWGVVYTIIGATSGACLAFLIARYTARDWISRKLQGSRWKKLDEDVSSQGWKVVAFTRLIPLFPFNLLNYALGLTSIPFSHYAVTSFICMLPATIAFISLSSSLGQLLKGQISKELIIGVVLIAALSLLPALWKKRAAKRRQRD